MTLIISAGIISFNLLRGGMPLQLKNIEVYHEKNISAEKQKSEKNLGILKKNVHFQRGKNNKQKKAKRKKKACCISS